LIRPCHLLLLALLASSCGERKKQESAAAPPEEKATRKERPASRKVGAEPDAKVALRESFDKALAEPASETRERALEQIAWDGIDVDPEVARKAFEELEPDSAASRRLVAHFAGRLADIDPNQAIEWANTLEQEQERAEAFGRIAVVISDTDPERGAGLLVAEMPAGITRDRAVVQVVQRWSQKAPSAAADWIAATPAGAARSAGLRSLVETWSRSDASGLAKWIEGRGDDDVKMESMLAVANSLRSEKKENRELRLADFHDPEIRRRIENLLAQSPP
jgi:hypothetical protein